VPKVAALKAKTLFTYSATNVAMFCIETGESEKFFSNSDDLAEARTTYPGFAFPATTIYRQLPLLRSFSAFVPEPKSRTRPAEPLLEPKGRDLPHF
jgi:hypothetical protein